MGQYTKAQMTKTDSFLLGKINEVGVITDFDRAFLPGLHFCDEWDGLAIFKHSPEWECCTCQIKREMDNEFWNGAPRESRPEKNQNKTYTPPIYDKHYLRVKEDDE